MEPEQVVINETTHIEIIRSLSERLRAFYVFPDVSVPPEQSLNAAYHMALESVVGSNGEPASGPFSLPLKEAQAALKDTEKG